MKKVIKVDINGLYLEDVILSDDELTPTDCVEMSCPDGFYRPKWDGTRWVEGGTAPVPTLKQQITALKVELELTDYKIIKCSEYQLAGFDMPYDIAVLHAERQTLRDRINELELLLI